MLSPVVTSSVTATSATIFLVQPINSLPADQYRVTLTRKRNAQPLCQDFEATVTRTSSSDSVLFEGLEEFSAYSVSVIARHNLFDLTRSLDNVVDIITLTAGRSNG